MTGYLLRRAGTSIVVLIGVSIFVFFLLHTIYPSPAIDVLGQRADPSAIARWNQDHGFNDPFFVQYLHYLNNLVHGDLGYSYKVNQSVLALFSGALGAQPVPVRVSYLPGGRHRHPAGHLPGRPAQHHR